MNRRQLVALPIASALTAVAVLRLCYHADLVSTCTTQDNLFADQQDASPDHELTSDWAVRAQVRAYGGLGASAWWANLAQAAVLWAWSRDPTKVTDAWCVALLGLLAVWGDWHLVSGRCDAGVTPCGDARYALGANNCAYPVDGVLDGPVPHGCLVCDDTARTMGWAGMGWAAAAVAVVAAATTPA